MSAPRVRLVTLGCARNDADSEELAGRLTEGGFAVLPADSGPGRVDAVLVNTCGFVAAAKKDSIDALLAAADAGAPVIAVGCLAERYGADLAAQLPEAAAVLSFDDYPDIAGRLRSVLDGQERPAHVPADRRRLLPVTPVNRVPRPPTPRQRLDAAVSAPLRLASGCDRRCAFCAIPSFRGAFVSRPPEEILEEADWLARRGVREVVLVSENSTSYGKDLGDLRALERLLPALAATPGLVRVRVVYLQPAEMRPGLLDALLRTPGVASYLDLSFQHASASVLRRMRRFGDTEAFLGLLASARDLDPQVGVRSNVIVGFPGERRADVAELERFLTAARLDAVGVFGYSDEDGTEAVRLPSKVGAATIRRREARLGRLVEELTAQRAAERVGSTVEVLLESVTASGGEGRAAHQAPDVDGSCQVRGSGLAVGDLVAATVVGSDGVDLRADLLTVLDGARAA